MRRALVLALVPFAFGFTQIHAGDDDDSPHLRWTRGYRVPIHYHSGGYSGLEDEALFDAYSGGLAAWVVNGSSLNFVLDPQAADGDTPAVDGVNTIRFEEDEVPREVDPNHTLAFTSPVAVLCTGIIIEADITFNGVSFNWSTSANRPVTDVQSVMAHEVGHLLGLDHSARGDAVMVAASPARTVRRELTADDRAGVRAIYGLDLGEDCEANRDCEGGEVCILGLQSDEESRATCAPPLGDVPPGGRCDGGADFCDSGCANGLCGRDGRCSALCRDAADCPGDQTCLPQDVGDGVFVSFCLDLHLCEDDIDDCPAGEACVITAHPEGDRAIRICTDAGERALGEACNANDECAGALCFGGRCSQLCDGGPDCAAPYDCERIEVPVAAGVSAEIGLCTIPETPCSRPADCPEGLSCSFFRDENDAVVSLCSDNPGGPAGTPCEGPGDCRAGLCLFEGVCADVCTEDADCEGDFGCESLRFGAQVLEVCSPPEPQHFDGGIIGTPDAAMMGEADAGEVDPSPDAGTPEPPMDAASPQPRMDAASVTPAQPDQGVGIVHRVDGDGGGGSSGCSLGGGRASWVLAAPLLLLGLRRRRGA